MSTPPFDLAKADRCFAVELNNLSWTLLERNELTPDERGRVVGMAHASCHHWRQVGNPANHARGECLVANAYAATGNGVEALRHADRSLELLRAHPDEMQDWDEAFVLDAVARAHAAAGQSALALYWKAEARASGDRIAEAEERAVFDPWHAGGQWHGIAERT